MTSRSAVTEIEAWYRRNARVLPWRSTRDPYRIWISEVMLQQTQVATVIPYYHKFLELFPTVEALGEATEETVLAAWSGLGYYSRARNLHRGAKFVVEHHAGKFPATREEILEVPGVGPYTAGAVLSIAYGLREPLVDGNVQRVFARYFGVKAEVSSREAQSLFWTKAREWVEASADPRDLNQALMELGATVCIKGRPLCAQCPIARECVAFREGSQEELPRKKKRRETEDLWWVGLVLESDGKYFLQKNQKGEWWADLWDFPHAAVEEPRELRPRAVAMVREVSAEAAFRELDPQRHTVTHHRIHVAPYLVRMESAAPRADGEWFSREQIAALPLSSLARKILEASSQ